MTPAVLAEPLKVSEDGYIRMTLERFAALPFAERQSIIADDLLLDLQHEGVPAETVHLRRLVGLQPLGELDGAHAETSARSRAR